MCARNCRCQCMCLMFLVLCTWYKPVHDCRNALKVSHCESNAELFCRWFIYFFFVFLLHLLPCCCCCCSCIISVCACVRVCVCACIFVCMCVFLITIIHYLTAKNGEKKKITKHKSQVLLIGRVAIPKQTYVLKWFQHGKCL